MIPATARALLALVPLSAACLASAGCQGHYVTTREAPLYASCDSEVEVGRIAAAAAGETDPRCCWEATDPDEYRRCERVRIRYRGRDAWIARDDVRLFSYVHPALDGGDDRAEVVPREVGKTRDDLLLPERREDGEVLEREVFGEPSRSGG